MPKPRLKSICKQAAEELLKKKYNTKNYYSPAEIAEELGLTRQALTPITPKMVTGLHYLKGNQSASILITEYGREVLLKKYRKESTAEYRQIHFLDADIRNADWIKKERK